MAPGPIGGGAPNIPGGSGGPPNTLGGLGGPLGGP